MWYSWHVDCEKVTRVDIANLLDTSDYIAHVFVRPENTFLLTSKNIILVCGKNHWAKRGFHAGQLTIEKFIKLPKVVLGIDDRFKLINISKTYPPIFVFTIKNKVVFSYPDQDSGDGVFSKCKNLCFKNGEYLKDIVIHDASYASLLTSENRIINLKFDITGRLFNKSLGVVFMPTQKMKMLMPIEGARGAALENLEKFGSTVVDSFRASSFIDLSFELGHLFLNSYGYAELLQLRRVCRWFRDTINSISIPPTYLPPQQSVLTFLDVLNNIMRMVKSSALKTKNLARKIEHLKPSALADPEASTFIPAHPDNEKRVALEQVLRRMLIKRTKLTRRAHNQSSFCDASIRDPLRELNNIFWSVRQLLGVLKNHPKGSISFNELYEQVAKLSFQFSALEKALS